MQIEETKKSSLVIKRLNKKEIEKNSFLSEKLTTIAGFKTNINSKIITDTVYNFTVDTDFAEYIYNTETKLHSYTFVIQSNNPNLQNLIITKDSLNNHNTYVMEYDIPKQDFTSLDFNQLNQVRKKCSKINFNPSSIFNKCQASMELICIETWIIDYVPPAEGNNNGGSIEYEPIYVLQGSQCSFVYDDCGGGGDAGIGGGFNTSPTGGGGGGSNDPLDPFDGLPKEPCEVLGDLFSPSTGNVKGLITESLQPNIAVNPTGEKGTKLVRSESGIIQMAGINPTTEARIDIPSGGNIFCAMHTHPLSTYPMFSWSDVHTLYNLNSGLATHNQGLASFLLVCQDDNNNFQTYAIVFDPDSLNDTIDQFINSPENSDCSSQEIQNTMNAALQTEYETDNNYERAFLRFMSSSNVSLYRANSTLTNWSKLSLSNDSPTAIVNTTDCN